MEINKIYIEGNPVTIQALLEIVRPMIGKEVNVVDLAPRTDRETAKEIFTDIEKLCKINFGIPIVSYILCKDGKYRLSAIQEYYDLKKRWL